MGRPYGYLRKSRVTDLASDFGPETQEREVRALAARFGDNGERLAIVADWDISGAGKYTAKREGYQTLVRAIESGECTAAYSYSLSRLGRSVQELSRLFDLAHDRGVPIRLVADSLDTSTASGRMTANILASVAQFESDVASERRQAQNATKRARGESLRTRRRYGEGLGEDADLVLRLFHETGSFSRTARALNDRDIPARSGKQWYPKSVALVVHRLDPTIVSKGRGVAAGRVHFRLARLLACPFCRTPLSGTTADGSVRYACSNRVGKPHARSSISERRIIDWIKAEAGLFRVPAEQVETDGRDDANRADLEARRGEVLDMAEHRIIDRAERDRRLGLIADALERLESTRVVVDVPAAIDWDAWTPQAVNDVLRAMWARVELDGDLMPRRAEWTVPEWRA